MAGSYNINWSKFQGNIADYLQSMLAKDFLTDVSLYSGNQTWKVHKVVLCANSGYFEQLLRGLGVQLHPVLVLDHIHPEYISYLLEYMYTGSINIDQQKVQQFIQVSKMLKIRGISGHLDQQQNSEHDMRRRRQEDSNNQHRHNDNHDQQMDEESVRSHKSVTRKRRSSDRVKVARQSSRVVSPSRDQIRSDNKDSSEPSGNDVNDLNTMQSSREDTDTVVIKSEPFVEVGILDRSSQPLDSGGDDVRIKEEAEDSTNDADTQDYDNQDSTKRRRYSNQNEDPDTEYSLQHDSSSNIQDQLQDAGWTSGEEDHSPTSGSLTVRSDLLAVTQTSSSGHIRRLIGMSGSSQNQFSQDNSSKNQFSQNHTSNTLKNTLKASADQDRCHFCSLHCGSQEALTCHLKTVHMPPKHALCENCENFFHVCAIVRHKAKCQGYTGYFASR